MGFNEDAASLGCYGNKCVSTEEQTQDRIIKLGQMRGPIRMLCVLTGLPYLL